jgi:hypothetical protein
LSFFDETDEVPVAPQPAARPRRASSGRGGGGRSGGGGRGTRGGARRPPSDQQSIQVRRLIAAGAILVVLILIIVGIHSCQVSSRNSGLRNYANNVSSLIQQSNQNGSQLFSQLSSGGGQGKASSLSTQITQDAATASSQLSKAQGLSVPDEMQKAQNNVVLAMQMRRDGLSDVAGKISAALGTATNQDALNAIAADMAKFYASDVVYKGYATGQIASALHGAGIGVGGTDGVQIESGQFVPDVQWLTSSFIAGKIGATASSTTSNGKVAPGLHGHSLDSVAVGGNTLQSGSTNTIPDSPAPSFTLNLTNGGTNNETNVVCSVSVSGAGISAQTTIPQTTAGQSSSCTVQLKSSPPAGSYTVVAKVNPVPGEKNTANNTLSFPVTFQ